MMTKRTYERRLDGMLEEIFGAADGVGYTLKDLSRLSGLCYRTVQRLNRYDTRLPRLKTVLLLAEVVGVSFDVKLPEIEPVEPIQKPRAYRPVAGRRRRA